MTIAQPITSGNLILSLYQPTEVDEYTPDGQYVQTLLDGSDGLCEPTGSAFDAAGNLYVTDFQCDQIFKIDTSGTVSVFASNDQLATTGLTFDAPESIAFDPSGSLMYVSNANRDEPGGGIDVLDAATGAGIANLPLPSSNGSEGMGESDWLAFNAQGLLYMTNENPVQGVMQVDLSTGDIVQPSFAANLPDVGYAPAFDKQGHLWVADTSSILEFDASGTLLQQVSNPAINTAFAAVFDPSGSTLYVGDLGNGNVYTYGTDGVLQGGFGTGASGINGIAVAGNPLLTGAVDPALSTVAVSPAQVPADGQSPAWVTVTLRDALGNPVAGKIVNVTSSRDGDVVAQPIAATDASGAATALLTSQQAGQVMLSAVDVSDGVVLDQTASVSFVPSDHGLAAEVSVVQSGADSLLTGATNSLAATAQQIAADGDAMTVALAGDAEHLTVDWLTDASSLAASFPDGVELHLPGIGNQGWSHILNFDEQFDPQRTVFDDAFEQYVRFGNGSGLTPRVITQGIRAYAADAGQATLNDVTTDAAIKAVEQLIGTQTQWMSTGLLPPVQRRATLLQQDVDQVVQQTLAALPPMDAGTAQAWTQNLADLAKANIALASYQQVLANTVHALRIDHDTEPLSQALEEFLRAGGQALSYGVAPVGPVLYNGALLGLDTAIDTAKLQEAGSTAALAAGGLNGIPNTIIAIDQNTVNGLLALQRNQAPDAVSGSIVDTGDVSHQSCWIWHLKCTEQSSTSSLQVTNTGAQPARFVVNATYMTKGGTLGVYPLGQVASGSAVIAAHQTATIQVTYKDGAHGASPAGGSSVSLDLLATPETPTSSGTYLVGHTYTTWAPQVIVDHMAPALARLHFHPTDDVASGPVPDLVTAFALPDPTQNGYELQYWINNSLATPITATVTQTIPPTLTVNAIGPSGSQGSGTVSWTVVVPGNTSQAVTMTVGLITGADTQILPAATADLVDTTGSDSGPLPVNALTLTPLTLVQIAGGLPGEITPGAALTVPYTVTNLAPSPIEGMFALTLTDQGGATVFATQQPVALDANGSTVASVSLPITLPIGLLAEAVSVSGPDMSPATMSDAVEIANPAPLVSLSGPGGPLPYGTALPYTLAITNDTPLPVSGLVVTATVSGPASIDPASVTGDAQVGGNTITWMVPGSLNPGSALVQGFTLLTSGTGTVHVQAVQGAQAMLSQTVDAWTVLEPPPATPTAPVSNTPVPSAPTSTPVPTSAPTNTPSATPPAALASNTPVVRTTQPPAMSPTPIPATDTATAAIPALQPPTATATSVAVPGTASPTSPTPAVQRCTASSVRVSLGGSMAFGGVALPVTILGPAQARGHLMLRVVTTRRVTIRRHNRHLQERRTVVLYQSTRAIALGAQRRLATSLPLAYKPAVPVPAQLMLSLSNQCGRVDQRRSVEIQPAPRLTVAGSVRAGGKLLVQLRTVSHAAVSVNVSVSSRQEAPGRRHAHRRSISIGRPFFSVTVKGRTDRRGHFMTWLRIGYHPRQRRSGVLLVSVRAGANTVVLRRTLTIHP